MRIQALKPGDKVRFKRWDIDPLTGCINPNPPMFPNKYYTVASATDAKTTPNCQIIYLHGHDAMITSDQLTKIKKRKKKTTTLQPAIGTNRRKLDL